MRAAEGDEEEEEKEERKERIQEGGSKRLQGAMTGASTRGFCRLI